MTNESGIASALMDFAKPVMGTVADDARPDDMTPVLDIAVAYGTPLSWSPHRASEPSQPS